MDMSAIEDQLQQLALKLDEPFSSSGDPDEVCMALGRRGRELHRGYIRCARGGYLIASRTLLRPALEANILLRFVRQHPEQRSRLWATEPVRLSIKIDEVVREHRLVEQGVISLVLPSEDELLEMHREVARARKAANDAGIPGVSRNGPLVPNLREQVELIDTPETWQAYATAYMVLNSEQHIGRFSFEQSFRSERPDWGLCTSTNTSSSRASASSGDLFCLYARGRLRLAWPRNYRGRGTNPTPARRRLSRRSIRTRALPNSPQATSPKSRSSLRSAAPGNAT